MNELLITLLIPFVGAIALAFIPKKLANVSAGVVSIITFVVSLLLFVGFEQKDAKFQFITSYPWVPSLDINFKFGLDGMSLLLVMLTTFIFPIAIISSRDSVKDRENFYYSMLLFLEFGVIGVFSTLDTFVFYVFWELVLIPMYFLIGLWGGKDRIYAAVKFFIFTMAGSLMMLVAIIWLGNEAQKLGGAFTADMIKLMKIAPNIAAEYQHWLFLAFALSFCIKVPLFPLHTWLPDAHTQAPTAGSVILAAVLLKMGTYGLIRFNLQLFPQSSLYYADVISVLAVIGIIYGALLAMVQTDIKKLVAYSSVAHLGFVVLGIFSMTTEGVQGAVLQMVNHGLSTGMLFLCVGFIYERRHTREITEFGGIAKSMPVFAVLTAFAMLSSVGAPGLNGFVGEYLTLIGAFVSQHLATKWFAVIAGSGVIFAAVYLLLFYQKIFMGPLNKSENMALKDLSKMEIGVSIPLVIMFIWIGFQPTYFLKISEASSRAVVGVVEKINGENRYAPEANQRLGILAQEKTEQVNNSTQQNQQAQQQAMQQTQQQAEIQKMIEAQMKQGKK